MECGECFYSRQGKEKELDNGWCLLEWLKETKILCQVVKNQPFNNLYPAGQANAEARSVSFTFSLIFIIHIFDLIPKGILFFSFSLHYFLQVCNQLAVHITLAFNCIKNNVVA